MSTLSKRRMISDALFACKVFKRSKGGGGGGGGDESGGSGSRCCVVVAKRLKLRNVLRDLIYRLSSHMVPSIFYGRWSLTMRYTDNYLRRPLAKYQPRGFNCSHR
ncbi:hypothetical protein M0804_002815 [Polistes exclamans]|nr:hypothetical protein M0804_002815 [Polistes exclamans]